MKKLHIILITIIFSFNLCFFGQVYALHNPSAGMPSSGGNSDSDDIESVFSSADSFISDGKQGDISIDESALSGVSNFLTTRLIYIGVALAVIIATILGIQFMIGSTEEKAKVTEALVPFVIGCIVIFGSFTLWRIFVNIGNKL